MTIADMRASALSELDRYGRYARGWDAYRAEPFAAELLRFARNFIELAATFLEYARAKPTAIVTGPASDGSIDIEIQLESRRLILTFYSNSAEVPVYRVDRDYETFETIPFKVAALVNELSWVAA
jgi:hypothetical protein